MQTIIWYMRRSSTVHNPNYFSSDWSCPFAMLLLIDAYIRSIDRFSPIFTDVRVVFVTAPYCQSISSIVASASASAMPFKGTTSVAQPFLQNPKRRAHITYDLKNLMPSYFPFLHHAWRIMCKHTNIENTHTPVHPPAHEMYINNLHYTLSKLMEKHHLPQILAFNRKRKRK